MCRCKCGPCAQIFANQNIHEKDTIFAASNHFCWQFGISLGKLCGRLFLETIPAERCSWPWRILQGTYIYKYKRGVNRAEGFPLKQFYPDTGAGKIRGHGRRIPISERSATTAKLLKKHVKKKQQPKLAISTQQKEKRYCSIPNPFPCFRINFSSVLSKKCLYTRWPLLELASAPSHFISTHFLFPLSCTEKLPPLHREAKINFSPV